MKYSTIQNQLKKVNNHDLLKGLSIIDSEVKVYTENFNSTPFDAIKSDKGLWLSKEKKVCFSAGSN